MSAKPTSPRCWSARCARRAGDCVGLKPICCGDRDDAELLHAAAEGAIALDDVNPVWLRIPGAPYTASHRRKPRIPTST